MKRSTIVEGSSMIAMQPKLVSYEYKNPTETPANKRNLWTTLSVNSGKRPP